MHADRANPGGANAPAMMTRDARRLIWEAGRVPENRSLRLEFPSLARFHDHWYCAFREATSHYECRGSRIRLIRSADGELWETAALFDCPTGDIREMRLSLSPQGILTANCTFVYLAELAPLKTIDGVERAMLSVTWLSDDGLRWDGPFECPSGVNTYRWDTAWHAGFAYSVGYGGKDDFGTLYRTRDGKRWDVVVENFFPERRGTEGSLAFSPDGAACCLLRGAGGGPAGLGTARPPYRDWEWKELDVHWDGDGIIRPLYEVTNSDLAGPTLITLRDGRLLGACYVYSLDDRQEGVTLFLVHPREAVLERVLTVAGGGSYPGLVECDGRIWFTCGSRVDTRFGIFMGSVPLPTGSSFSPAFPAGEEKRCREMEACRDPARLAEAAAQEKNRHVRLAAVRNLDDTGLLSRLATQDPSWMVRGAARAKLQGAVVWDRWFLRLDPEDRGVTEDWFRRPAGDKDWRVVEMPAMWKHTWAGTYLGIGWYAVNFQLPDRHPGQDLQLIFEGVDAEAWVYVNGRAVGEHTAASTGKNPDDLWDKSFAIRVPSQALNVGGHLNLLSVRVKAGRCNGGIHQPVLASLRKEMAAESPMNLPQKGV